MIIQDVTVYRVQLPYDRPYPLSFNSVHMAGADAIVARIRDRDGRIGWGEVTIIPGYTHETVDGGLAFGHEHGAALVGMKLADAKRRLIAHVPSAPHAVTPLLTALEMVEDHPLLKRNTTQRVPVLAPVRNLDAAKIPAEIEELLGKGHKTLKIKMGFDVDADLQRLDLIYKLTNGRARLRIDANQGYDREGGCRFAAALDPRYVQWFEQPCDRHDWESNAAVARVSAVPVMLDEQIYGFADIQRAAGVKGVAFVKHVLEKYGGLELLKTALDHIRICGMQPVLGNGGATDITSWQEACVATHAVDLPCEMHSFLKVKEPLLDEPLPFESGDIVLRPDYRPGVNESILKRYTVSEQRFATPVHAVH